MRYVFFLLTLLLPSALLGQPQDPASPQQPSEQTDEAGQTSAESSAAPAAEPAPQTGAAEASPSPTPAAPQAGAAEASPSPTPAAPQAGAAEASPSPTPAAPQASPAAGASPPAQQPAAAGSAAPQAAPAQPPQQSNQAQPSSASTPGGLSFRFRGASLHEFIDVVAKSLGINYILDPAVGDAAVTINTYGPPAPRRLVATLAGDPKNPWSGCRPSGQPLPHSPLRGGAQVTHSLRSWTPVATCRRTNA